MSILECKNISFAYEGEYVLRDISFSVTEGSYLCIVGENGTGKSTLLKCLLGLKSIRSGSIIFNDGLSSRDIGYLPQQTPAQKDFPAGVFEIVLSGCLNQRGIRPYFSKKEKEKTLMTMKNLGIEDLKNKCFRELSGGQQQRVLLARAFNAAGRMILFDEPVTGLDPIASDELYDMINRINHEFGITVIMVSHDLHFALRNADSILHLNKDSYFFGSVEEYMDTEEAGHFLGREIHV